MAGLSEEFIEERIVKSAYEKEVRQSVRRFYEDLDRPAAPMMAYEGVCDSAQIIENMRKKGLHAVDEADPKAVDPDVFVVTGTSIQAPFLAPEEALKANIMMIESVLQCGDNAKVFYSNPLTREALSPAVEVDSERYQLDLESVARRKPGNKYDEIIDDFYQKCIEADPSAWFKYYSSLVSRDKEHPEASVALREKTKTKLMERGYVNLPPTQEQIAEMSKEIMNENKNLLMPYVRHAYEECMLQEAYNKGISPVLIDEENRESLKQGGLIKSLFHGGFQGGTPYAVLGASDECNFIYGAMTCGFTKFSVNGEDVCFAHCATRYAFLSNRQGFATNCYKRGFVYQYASNGDKQEILGIRYGDKKYTGEKISSKDYSSLAGIGETPIFPHQNKLEKIYLAVDNGQEQRLLPLELDENGVIKDKKWRDFVELHNPVDDNLKDFMVERRNNVIAQYDEQGAEKMNRKIHYVNFGKAASSENESVSQMLASLGYIQDFASKHDTDGRLGLADRFGTDYLRNDKKMITLDYWGEITKSYAHISPEGQEAFVRDIGRLAAQISTDIASNKDNKQYNAIKRRCVSWSATPERAVKELKATSERINLSQQPAIERETPPRVLTIKKGGWIR